jgi:hypothetical protein
MSAGNNTAQKFTYGTNTNTAIASTTYVRGVFFEKGPSGQDCFISVNSTGSPSYTVTLYDINLTSVVTASVSPASSGRGMFLTSPLSNPTIYLGRGIFATVPYSSATISSVVFGWVIGQVLSSDNPMTGPFSYLMWDKYGWNGSAWELNHAGSKTTHGTSDVLTNGVTLAFQNGAGTSFVNSDYYTFGVVKGILKDNSTAYTSTTEFYWTPVKTGTTFGGVVRTYPSTGVVTWKRTNSQLVVNPDNSLTNKSTSRAYGLWAFSNNRVFGDFSITGTISPGGTQRYISIGLSTALGGAYIYDTPTYGTSPETRNLFGFVMNPNNLMYPEVAGATAGSSTTITVPATAWEIRRIGTTVTFYIGGVLKHTLTSQSAHSYAIRVLYSQITTLNSQTFETVEPITVASSGVGYYTEAGVQASSTGVYDPDFMSIDSSTSAKATFQMSLNGVPVTYVNQDASTLPAPGEVNVLGEYGDFIFNPADVGKTVTGVYKYVTK